MHSLIRKGALAALKHNLLYVKVIITRNDPERKPVFYASMPKSTRLQKPW